MPSKCRERWFVLVYILVCWLLEYVPDVTLDILFSCLSLIQASHEAIHFRFLALLLEWYDERHSQLWVRFYVRTLKDHVTLCLHASYVFVKSIPPTIAARRKPSFPGKEFLFLWKWREKNKKWKQRKINVCKYTQTWICDVNRHVKLVWTSRIIRTNYMRWWKRCI